MLLYAIAILLILSSSVAIDERLQCEPRWQQLGSLTPKYWITRYNMNITKSGFTAKYVRHSDSYLANTKPGRLDAEFESDKVHDYVIAVEIKQVGRFMPFRRIGRTLIYHFCSGDSMTVHQIDPVTQRYQRTELGHHSRKYTVVIKSGTWYAVDIEDHHIKMKYVIVGVTILREGSTKSYLDFGVKDNLVKQFPQQEEIIMKYS